ncbi:hypothetical protein EJ05DRAFT_471828 [Pseudovirgaria hyperparasitica]|uniref:Uncharacterized protein n=1 Tax=Pseudovirgaria hyperparasitica TaxID=470096 RepID=A0A6A6WKY9_9PEZI|nr:uncharacterized protein EJ05DRAFT_471828 [Pseudovirgaria hyperparasitica]KAF2762865.1 hypothetical protein EJ05DRAFT_471828 [Pseudovirgaria hyperparasitica]
MEFRNLSNRLHEISLNWAGSAPGQKPNQIKETTDYSPPSRATIVKSFEPLRIPFPVPISKSDASKVLRAAAFEFIVCHFLTAEIFRVLPPAYPFERGPIEDFLAELVTRDPGLESLLRPALISAAGKERVDQETIASTMARETLEVCRQSIPHFHPTEDLEMVTQSFFVSCLDTWMRAQRCRRRVVASSIVDTPMSQWNPWDALGSPVEPDTENQAMQTEPLDPEVVLFPQIVATDMAGKPSGVLFEGCLMWGDELLVMQGRLEYRRFCDKKRARRDSMMSKRRDSLASRDTPTRVEERKRA